MTYGLEGRCSIQLSYWRQTNEKERVSDELPPAGAILGIPCSRPTISGRGEKIRTSDTLLGYAPLAGECLRPLGHVSELGKAGTIAR